MKALREDLRNLDRAQVLYRERVFNIQSVMNSIMISYQQKKKQQLRDDSTDTIGTTSSGNGGAGGHSAMNLMSMDITPVLTSRYKQPRKKEGTNPIATSSGIVDPGVGTGMTIHEHIQEPEPEGVIMDEMELLDDMTPNARHDDELQNVELDPNESSNLQPIISRNTGKNNNNLVRRDSMGNIIPVRALSGNNHLTIISRDSMNLYTSVDHGTEPANEWTPEWQHSIAQETVPESREWDVGSPIETHLMMGSDGMVDIPIDAIDTSLHMGYSSHIPGLLSDGIENPEPEPRSESTSSMASISLDNSFTGTSTQSLAVHGKAYPSASGMKSSNHTE